MKESEYSINLMRLNCDLINIKNTNPYLAGEQCLQQNWRAKFGRLWKNRKRIGKYISQKIKYERYKANPDKFVDFVVEFKPRKVEDFMIDDYRDVGKGVVYTAVFGGYDEIVDPMFVNPNLEYYAFTDSELPENGIWKKVDLSKFPQLEGLDSYHKAKYIKMFPYEFFPDADFSIWIDGNVNLIADTYPVAIMSQGAAMATYSNPLHDCIYTEGRYMVYQGRVSAEKVKEQLDTYSKNGFPEHFGMREFSIIYRDHKNEECYNMMKEWWRHVNTFTMRDQLSFSYILWKNGKTIDYIRNLGENWRMNPRFRQKEHHYQVVHK